MGRLPHDSYGRLKYNNNDGSKVTWQRLKPRFNESESENENRDKVHKEDAIVVRLQIQQCG